MSQTQDDQEQIEVRQDGETWYIPIVTWDDLAAEARRDMEANPGPQQWLLDLMNESETEENENDNVAVV